MKSFVLSIGGSVVAPEKVDSDFLRRLADFLTTFAEKHQVFVVIGGGVIARKYVTTARNLGVSEKILDKIGIQATRMNAQLILSLLANANTQIPQTVDEAIQLSKKHHLVVMGGTQPGQSTDAVAAQLAETVKADKLVIATNVTGVYNKDPHQHDDATLFDHISVDELMNMSGDLNWSTAGKNMVIDGIALRIIKQAQIPTFVVQGNQLDNLKHLLNDKSFTGTTITV